MNIIIHIYHVSNHLVNLEKIVSHVQSYKVVILKSFHQFVNSN